MSVDAFDLRHSLDPRGEDEHDMLVRRDESFTSR